MKRGLMAVVGLVCMIAAAAAAAVVVGVNSRVGWAQSAAPDVAGYKIMIGPAPGNYTITQDVGLTSDPAKPEASLKPFVGRLGPGPHFLSVVAYDRAGNMSEPSDPIEFDLDLEAPPKIDGVQITP